MRQHSNFSSGDNGSGIAIISILYVWVGGVSRGPRGHSRPNGMAFTSYRITFYWIGHDKVNGNDDFWQFVLHACIYWQFMRINEWYEIPLNMQATAHTHTMCSSGCCCCRCGFFPSFTSYGRRGSTPSERIHSDRAQHSHCFLHINFSFQHYAAERFFLDLFRAAFEVDFFTLFYAYVYWRQWYSIQHL